MTRAAGIIEKAIIESAPPEKQPASGFPRAQAALNKLQREVSLAPQKKKFETLLSCASALQPHVDAGWISQEKADAMTWEVAIRHGIQGSPGSPEEAAIAAIVRQVCTPPTLRDEAAARDQVSGADEIPWEDGATDKRLQRETPRPWARDPATIPPRQTLYDGHYFRKAASVTVGAGGRAKTTRAIYEAISMACGFDLATREEIPAGKLAVWILNGEEDQDELDRRVAATCLHYDVSTEDLGSRLFVQSVRDTPLRIAAVVNNRPTIDQSAKAYLTNAIKANTEVDVFIVDPLVSFHSVQENDNGHMDVVIKEGFGAVANQTNAACELLHHPGKPKPGQADTTVEDGRGASAVIWAVRSARVLNFMSEDEARKLGLGDEERRLHVRIANGKANMGPLGRAKWMRLQVQKLPNGDLVAVASPWSPPNPFDGITASDMELARRLAATGEYRQDSRSPKWIGYALAEHLQMSLSHHGDNEPKDMARLNSIIKTWMKNKVLDIEERKDADGKTRKFVVLGSFEEPAPAHPEDDEAMNPKLADDWRQLADPTLLEGRCIPPVRQFRQSL